MSCETVAHYRDQLRVNLVLVLLIIALELVKLNEHDRLLRGEVPPEGLANVGYERDDNRKRLRGERKVLRGDVFETSGAHCTGSKNDLTRPGVESLEKLNDARHRVCCEQAEVDNHFEIVREENQHFLSGGNRVVAPFLDAEMFPER